MKVLIQLHMLLLIAIVAAGIGGCREREAPQPYPVVMETESLRLTPPPPLLNDPGIMSGSAQIVGWEGGGASTPELRSVEQPTDAGGEIANPLDVMGDKFKKWFGE